MRTARTRLASGARPEGRRARPWIVTSAILLCGALGTAVALHLVAGRNPVTAALSVFATPTSSGWLLAVSAAFLATGSLATLGALRAATLPVRGLPGALLASWAGGLAVTATFRASLSLHPAPGDGVVHRWAAAIAFLSLPGAGFALAAKLRPLTRLAAARTTLTRASTVAAATLVVFGILYLVRDPGPSALPVGLAQRLTLLSYLALLATMLRAGSRAARLHRSSRVTY